MADTSLIGDTAAPYVLLSPANRYIGTIVADVTVREVHTDEDTITVFPVESGTPISDHVFANPKIVEISCGFSDSTAGYVGAAQDAYDAFLALKAQREPFAVSTGKRLYQNMLFANITTVTDETSEYVLMVTVRLQEVIITNTDGGGSSASQETQASPEQTTDESQIGSKSLQFAPTASGYSDSGSGVGSISGGFSTTSSGF